VLAWVDAFNRKDVDALCMRENLFEDGEWAILGVAGTKIGDFHQP
jgi:hypothetical protein